MQWLTLGEWGFHLNNDPKAAQCSAPIVKVCLNGDVTILTLHLAKQTNAKLNILWYG